MNKKVKKKWIGALLGDEYQQGQNTLHNTTENTFCCLGVLCDLAVKDGVDIAVEHVDGGRVRYGESLNYLPKKVREWAGLDSDNPMVGGFDAYGKRRNVASLNDKGATFVEIAELIKESL